MSLADDLREQARHLAIRERRRPRQASLRRAVSAAYYSLFHLLIDEATRVAFGGSFSRRRLRHALARSFSHQSMVAACESFHGGALPASIAASVAPLPIPPELRELAGVFVKLQEERHRADYNLAAPFVKSEVLALLRELDGAVAGWHRIRREDAARFFLMALPLWDQLRR
jgi:hypothetical protein